MSILIAAYTKRSIYIASDKRVVNALNDFEISNDNATKVSKLREDTFFYGGTVSSQSEHFSRLMLAYKDAPSHILIEALNKLDRRWEFTGLNKGKLPEFHRTSQMMLFGFDKGRGSTFTWQGNTDGSNEVIFNDEPWLKYHISMLDMAKAKIIEQAFVYQIKIQRNTPIQAVNNCMRLGRRLSPDTISEKFDTFSFTG